MIHYAGKLKPLDGNIGVAMLPFFACALRNDASLLSEYAGNQAASVARAFLAGVGAGPSGGQLSQSQYDAVFQSLTDALSDEESNSAVVVGSALVIL